MAAIAPAEVLAAGLRVTDGILRGRVQALWCDLGDEGAEYARIYLDEPYEGSPWLIARCARWRPAEGRDRREVL